MSQSYDEGYINGAGDTWTCTLNPAGESYSDYSGSKGTSVFGGPEDPLGLSTPSEVNANDFGAAFSVTAGAQGAVVAVDAIRVKVFYIDDITAAVKEQGRPDSFASVAFGDGNTILIVGAKGDIRRSTDNGSTWSVVASGTLVDLYHIARVPGGFVVAGDRGTLLRSTDNGATWIAEQSGTLSGFRRLLYTGSNRVVALASDGVTSSSVNNLTWLPTRS